MPQIYPSVQAIMNLQRPNGSAWYSITNKAEAGPAQVSIYDEIGMWGIKAGQFIEELSNISGPLEVHLNTPGGEVFDGIAIYTALKNRQGVTVIIDSLAASIGSVIAMGADPGQLFIEPNARMMIHDGFAMAAGNADELEQMVAQLHDASDNIAGIYAERTGQPATQWRSLMKATTWYSAEDAVAAGLADKVKGKITNQARPTHCTKCSAEVGITFKYCGQCGNSMADWPVVDLTDDEEIGDGWVMRDGKPVFDPDGDGDDDSTAAGDTDHDYWDADGKQIKDIPPCPKVDDDELTDFLVTALFNSAVDNSPWDASKAWKAGSAASDPAAFFGAICAGEKTSGDPKTQAHWALPFKYSPSSAPNKAGVSAALGRLNQTKDLKNPDAVKAKLQKVMKQINPDYEPSDELVESIYNALKEGNSAS